jgi:TPR repeat protein
MKVPLANAKHGLLVLGLAISIALPARAEIEKGRMLMESHRFEEAMAEFLPAARSGNADAEELIGVMYAMGLGVERDDERAFEWYLRASMKGHPGAQSGIYRHAFKDVTLGVAAADGRHCSAC